MSLSSNSLSIVPSFSARLFNSISDTPQNFPDAPVFKFEYTLNADYYDAERKFCWWNGKLYMMFGKYARKESLREIARKDSGYLEWMLGKDFSDEVKALVEGALKGQFPKPVTAVVENP